MDIKTDINGLFKDPNSGGIINKDNMSLYAYKKQKELQRRFKNLEKRLQELEDKLNLVLFHN